MKPNKFLLRFVSERDGVRPARELAPGRRLEVPQSVGHESRGRRPGRAGRAQDPLEAPERDRPELERRREDADRDGVRAVLARRCVS